MVTRHLLQRRLAVLLGNGKGAFALAAGSPVALEYQPGRMAPADVNYDGVLDLAVTSRDGNRENINILLGNGRGEFSRAVGSPFTASASIELYKPDVQFADVNGDEKLDVLTANGRRNTIEVLVGDGQGGFSEGTVVRLESGRDLYSFATGDVDGDGRVDVVTASSTESGGPGSVVLLRGDGQGGFAERVESTVSVPSAPRMGMVADVNRDRRPDITLAHGEGSFVSVLVNQGQGVLAPPRRVVIEDGMSAFEIVVADVNQDAHADLVATTVRRFTPPSDSRIAVFLGGSGGWVPAPGSPFRAGPGAYSLDVADLNKDGKLDIVASSFDGNALTVLQGRRQ